MIALQTFGNPTVDSIPSHPPAGEFYQAFSSINILPRRIMYCARAYSKSL